MAADDLETHKRDERLAWVAHELRTPIAAILGWVERLRMPEVTADVIARGLAVIERNAHAQSRLVEDLLDMSRIARGTLALEVRPFDLASMLASAADDVRLDAEAKGVCIALELEPEPIVMQGDPDRLRQVAANLLANAVKFTSAGCTITVRLARFAAGARFEVADDGIGIDREMLPHVFERARKPSTRRTDGLGLGLTIVRELVALHGGVVEARSPGLGHGATFIVTL